MIKQRMTQYSVAVRNEPGELHRVAQILGKEGITFVGLNTQSVNNVGFVQFVTESGNVGRKPLENAGYEVIESPCFQLEVGNRREEFIRLTKCLADEDVNILNVYGTANHGETWKLILTVDKPEKAQAALAKLGEAVAV